jgi:hypothetical protein
MAGALSKITCRFTCKQPIRGDDQQTGPINVMTYSSISCSLRHGIHAFIPSFLHGFKWSLVYTMCVLYSHGTLWDMADFYSRLHV